MDTNASTYEYEMDGDVIDENPSLTNQLLRQIIQELSGSTRCWYIGYGHTLCEFVDGCKFGGILR